MSTNYRLTGDFPLWLAGGTAVLAATFVLLAGHEGGFLAAQALSRRLPPALWESLTMLGDMRLLLALFLPFCWRYPRLFWGVILAAVLAGLACRGIKFALSMPRPAAELAPQQIVVIGQRLLNHSMPAGHAASAFAVAGVLGAFVPRRLGWVALALAAVVGFSRIAVGAHWPIDVLVGAIFGLLAAWLALQVVMCSDWGMRPRPFMFQVGLAALATATLPFDDQGYPGSLALRLACCVWGLSGLTAHFVRAPRTRRGW